MRSWRECVASESEEKRKMPMLSDGQKEKCEKGKGDVIRRIKEVTLLERIENGHRNTDWFVSRKEHGRF